MTLIFSDTKLASPIVRVADNLKILKVFLSSWHSWEERKCHCPHFTAECWGTEPKCKVACIISETCKTCEPLVSGHCTICYTLVE